MRPAIFFDRDGVLNKDSGYVFRREDWKWNDGAREAISLARERGFAVVVVTNQSGIARGFYGHDEVCALHDEFLRPLVDGIYYCPHAPDSNCECRKPLPGMIEQAIRELDLDRSRSFLIGDNDTDVMAAQAAGIPGYLYAGGDLESFLRPLLLRSQAR